MSQLKIQFGNVSNIYEVKVPQLVLNSRVDGGNIILDWFGYDISDKYFAIYRKSESSNEWETIVSLDNHFSATSYIDKENLDISSPDISNVDVDANLVGNDISLNFISNDNGNKYLYYIEAYDSKNNLLAISISN